MTLRFASGEFYGRDEVRRDHAGFGFASLTAVGGQEDVEVHTHETAHFVLVLSGGYLSTARGVPEVACAPTLVFNPAGTRHRDRFVGGKGRFLTLTVGDEAERAALDAARLDGPPIGLARASAVRPARAIERELRKAAPSTLVLESAAWQLIAGVTPEISPVLSPPAWLDTAQQMIRESDSARLSVGEVAAFVGVHPVHLARVFERWFGCAPGEYLRGRRLERAASLVGRGASALAETAIEAGFTDQAHLTRAFRDRFATTPAAWRRHVACVQAGRACLG